LFHNPDKTIELYRFVKKNVINGCLLYWKNNVSFHMNAVVRVEWCCIGIFQYVGFEKPVILQIEHDYDSKKIVLQLSKILRF
jgi:hypothetical protein